MTTSQAERSSTGWTADDSTFGARLALVRQRMSWGNVKEAATVCGIAPESWRTWERDDVLPRRIVEISSLIALKTGCDRMWLLTGERAGRPIGDTRGYPRGGKGGSRRRPGGPGTREILRRRDGLIGVDQHPKGRSEPSGTGPDLRRPAVLPRPVAA
ncbi:MAG TPA: hypothetical protein VL652_34795 [Kutzneria sp.]|jgi:hypothetical protein|nr:hypothetical protein [Kutzneria sp.]